MLTKRFTPDDVEEAGGVLRGGGVVAFPTETVYGLGADALNKSAVAAVFAAKGRPADNPLIIHVSSAGEAERYAVLNERAAALFAAFSPGPLTLVLEKRGKLPELVTAGLSTVAVRIPANSTALRLIAAAGTALAAPSANTSGRPSPTAAAHVLADLDTLIDAVIDGGECSVGVESTVLDLTREVPVLLRPGGVTKEELEYFLGEQISLPSASSSERPASPGMKYRHYAPRAAVELSELSPLAMAEFVNERSRSNPGRVGALVFDEFARFYEAHVAAASLGGVSRPADAARRLFAALRALDSRGVDVIYAPALPCEGLWSAVRNRLYKTLK